MSFLFKTQKIISHRRPTAFTLVEAVAAVTVLALISVTVLLSVDQSISASIEGKEKMEAFEVARENMEHLLASTSLSEMVAFGTSDKNPSIEWKTLIEPFYESQTARMWVKAVCSATYTTNSGEKNTIELTHWLTDISKEQLLQILKQQQLNPEDFNNLPIDIQQMLQDPNNQQLDKSNDVNWISNNL